MKRLGLGFSAVVFALSCYSPDLSGVRYTCDEANPYCPDGLECIAGSCLTPGSTPTTDGGTAMPDGTMAAAGCRSGQGFVVGTAFACPGAFNGNGGDNIPPASQLCADTYRICPDAAGIDQTACKMLSGFFAAQVNVRRNNSVYQCGVSGSNPFFAGCGGARSTVVDLPAGQMCQNFGQAIDCMRDDPWYCTDGNLNNISNSSNADGVLCCKM
jgi:hypothetical protein